VDHRLFAQFDPPPTDSGLNPECHLGVRFRRAGSKRSFSHKGYCRREVTFSETRESNQRESCEIAKRTGGAHSNRPMATRFRSQRSGRVRKQRNRNSCFHPLGTEEMRSRNRPIRSCRNFMFITLVSLWHSPIPCELATSVPPPQRDPRERIWARKESGQRELSTMDTFEF
jgi:hypothetical protein